MPRMLNAADENGVVTPGFLPPLPVTLGEGSFDAGCEDTRFVPLITATTELSQAFAVTWALLQVECGCPEEGVLAAPMTSAGAGHQHVQRALTAQREAFVFQALVVRLRALPSSDIR